MASNLEANSSQEPPVGPASPARRGGGGRGRGRGASQTSRSTQDSQDSNSTRGRGRGGFRGEGRGRGARDGAGIRDGQPREKSSGKAPIADVDTGKKFLVISKASEGSSCTGEIADGCEEEQTANNVVFLAPKAPLPPAEDAEDDDAEVCFICASPVQHTAIAPCNHRTCHICSLRLRALYKTKTCAHCRTESDHVIFTDSITKNYDEFSKSDFYKTDNNLGIFFENEDTFQDTLLLLRYNCPDAECDVACLGWPDLHRHVKTAHKKSMCDLCTRNKKVFTHEHELFTPAELGKHRKFGDDNPGAVDQSGFKGHPECGFCKERFYGDDELYAHCRDKHERCHICDRRDSGRKQQYFIDYNDLELHFRKDHFLCPDSECLEKKFVVFDSEMDLKAHQIEVHPNGLSKDALRDARRVDMSGFQYRTPHEPERGGRRDGRGRGRGRGRDPNAEPLPASSAQPMSRAELAYQRQMAIQTSGSQSATGRSFGGQLSTPTPSEAFAARPPSSAPTPSTVTVTATRSTTNDASSNNRGAPSALPPANAAPQTPADHARLVRHNAVVERASNLLGNDQHKLEEFRSQISWYRTSKVSATELIEGFFSLFDAGSVELGKLVKELADIYEVQAKKDSLLKAWNDWRAINEDYPSLPGAATALSLSGGPTAHGGSRVLKLKSSTAQSSRSKVNRQASWATSSSSTPFPPLPAASSSRSIGAKPGQTPWATSSSGARNTAVPSRSTANVSVGVTSRAPVSGADAFPALPAAPKPTSTIFSPGYTGLGLRRDNSGRNTPVNAWTAASGASTPQEEEPSVGGVGGGKKKGNKNKKQTLFHFG